MEKTSANKKFRTQKFYSFCELDEFMHDLMKQVSLCSARRIRNMGKNRVLTAIIVSLGYITETGQALSSILQS